MVAGVGGEAEPHVDRGRAPRAAPFGDERVAEQLAPPRDDQQVEVADRQCGTVDRRTVGVDDAAVRDGEGRGEPGGLSAAAMSSCPVEAATLPARR